MTGSPAASDLCSQRELNCEETVKSFQERWSDLFAAHLSVSGIASSASCMRSRTPSGLQQQPAGPQPVTTSVCSSPPESLLPPRTPLQAESPHSQRDEPWLDSPIEPIKDIFFFCPCQPPRENRATGVPADFSLSVDGFRAP